MWHKGGTQIDVHVIQLNLATALSKLTGWYRSVSVSLSGTFYKKKKKKKKDGEGGEKERKKAAALTPFSRAARVSSKVRCCAWAGLAMLYRVNYLFHAFLARLISRVRRSSSPEDSFNPLTPFKKSFFCMLGEETCECNVSDSSQPSALSPPGDFSCCFQGALQPQKPHRLTRTRWVEVEVGNRVPTLRPVFRDRQPSVSRFGLAVRR